MRSLITGIDGFVGGYLDRHLRDLGHEVFGMTGAPAKERRFYHGDLRDREFVSRTIDQVKPDRVFHLAAISFVPHGDAQEIYQVNLLGTLNLYEALKKPDRDVRMLFISSSTVYGAVPKELQPIREDFPLSPINHYAVSKASGEMLARLYRGSGIGTVIARPFNHTGRGQNVSFVVPKIAQAFRKKEASLKLGNIDAFRDFTDVRDVVKAYSVLLEKGEDTGAYNVCSGAAYSVRDVIRMLQEISGHEIRIEQDPAFMRSADIPYAAGDNSRIANAGWKPAIAFSETLKWMLDDDRH
jgi:nucleoside-diphosphate-sugar epimerase